LTPEITLVKFNETGIQNIANFTELLERFKANVLAVGGKYEAAYLTQGRYDAVVVTQMPNPEASVSAWLPIVEEGWTTETLPGIPENAVQQVIQNSRQHARSRQHA